ncbi:sodium/hydrogen exchanger family protein [Rhodopirellula maiorica SM1]|uniref:Sodium/hydrogen exchanger family protein n=1 Tax=Rhodopirellula maiorica SM1 TaxID=1265738 RepID=M5S577_9BACT|nr:cation:proton antiporter [Rhodopirellula maiorica]EMI21334.1 sodium/hydrogen exchanger family protein [Rhodopirellula maiorica SM1]
MTIEPVTAWSLLAGLIFLLAALGRGPLRRWPVSMPAIYLIVGAAVGPWGTGLLDFELIKHVKVVESVTEVAVLLSLLTAGLQLKPQWRHYLRAPIPLASVTMVITIAGVTLLGTLLLDLPLGAAVLLGAVLAPTDPVLASDVQVKHHDDTDRLRYALTGEAGLNDGAAFPFIMLGLGLLGHHELGEFGWRWLTVDLLWATTAGLGIGWASGYLVSRAAVWIKRQANSPTACEEALTLGLIGLSYGAALLFHAYGFLAVFAAGAAMRLYAEERSEGEQPDKLMHTVTAVNNQFGHIMEVAVVVMVGALVTTYWTIATDWWIAMFVFFLIRPMGVMMALRAKDIGLTQKGMISIFGIRGIGSLYYLSYAISHGLEDATANRLAGIVLTTIALSIMIHSNAASLMMRAYADGPKEDESSSAGK